MQDFKQFTPNNESLERVFEHTKGRNMGMITAHRAEYTPEENRDRDVYLLREIRQACFGYIEVRGRAIENHGTENVKAVDEHSYLVIGSEGYDQGQLKGFLRNCGKKYGQDWILHKAYNELHANLIGTNESNYRNEVNQGTWHPNRGAEFYSLLRGRTYAFESFQFLNATSWFSREEHDF